MKKIIVGLLLFLSFTTFAQQKTVTLSGKLVHFSNQVLIEDMSEFEYLIIPSSERLIIPDSAGNFNVTFKLHSPNYFRLGRNILYLTPGDKLETVVDYNDQSKSTFNGIGAEANNYLVNTPFPKAGSFLEAGKNLKQSPQETLAGIEDAAAKRARQLAAVSEVSPEFRRLEEARIKADVLNSLADVVPYAGISKKVSNAQTYIQAFNSAADSLKTACQKNFIDASLLKLAVYRDVAGRMVKDSPLNADAQKIKDYYTASGLVNDMNHEGDKASLLSYTKSFDSIKTVAYRNAVKAYLQHLLRFGKGDLAADFTATDISGEKVSLSSLKGKVIYVDIWATWCGPCLAEMPKLDEVKARYKDNANIVFLSLSIDDDNQLTKWKQNVTERKANGYQWQINRNKLNAYNITTIPRTLLIDKDFKIVSMSAPLPSAKSLALAIDKLLN